MRSELELVLAPGQLDDRMADKWKKKGAQRL